MPLRDYQESAVEAACNFLLWSSGHCYVKAPGGSGKSHMIAATAERMLDAGKRVLVLARSEKLLSQNKSKFNDAYQNKIGTYCAGLNAWDLSKPITIASVQSLVNATNIPQFDIALCDEVDEIPDEEDSQYRRLLSAAGEPRIAGYTATDFRTGIGAIKWGQKVSDIPIALLFEQKHLTPPTCKVGTTLDLSGVKVTLGDYSANQIAAIYEDPELLRISVEKIKQYSAERKAVLIFCQSLKHADAVSSAMEYNGMPNVIVSGDTDKEELGFILHDFEEGRIKYLLNVALLIRGYDMPCVDMIALLMATKSKRKFEQILYRGTRLKEGKENFLVLDMGNNFDEHGPLGSPDKSKKKGEKEESKGKICPECEEYITPPDAKECSDCGYVFPEPEKRLVKHSYEAHDSEKTSYVPVQTYKVTAVKYKFMNSKAGNRMIVVDYKCGFGKYGNAADFLLPYHASKSMRDKVQRFFSARGHPLVSPVETYSEDDLLWHAEQMKQPKEITIDHSGQHPQIIRYGWELPELEDSIDY